MTEVEQRFWSYVVPGTVPVHRPKIGRCWFWTGSRCRGYGQFSENGSNVRAHRYSWSLCRGAIPAGASVLHKCDVPWCVRPSHLFTGTQGDNMRDAWAKGRRIMPLKRGEEANGVKLTEQKVRAIRADYTGKHGDLSRLAREYGVDHKSIFGIVRRNTWRHVA